MTPSFHSYESRPVTRTAYEVAEGDRIEKVGEATYVIAVDGNAVQFKAYEPILPGDYIVYLTDDDIYHCSRAVFHERNVVED